MNSKSSFAAVLRSCGALGLLVSAACASTPKAPSTRPKTPAQEAFAEHSFAVRAMQAEADAARAEGEHGEGMIRSVQLRAGTQGTFEDGDGGQAAVRLNLDRPFRTSELSHSRAAAAEAADALVEAELYKANATTCDESVEAHAHAARKQHLSVYRGQLEALLARTRAFMQAGTLDPVSGARTELQLSRRLLETRVPGPGLRAHPKLGSLPEAVDAPGPLDADAARLNERIAEKHPEVRAHLASAAEHQHAATSERRARLPWLDYLQLDMASGGGAPNLGGRVAVEIPLDTGARGRAERHAHLSVSETYRAMGSAAELTQLASAALLELGDFEAEAAQQRSILEQADRADALADKFLKGHAETPDHIAQLMAEAHAGRMAVIDARERAGKAACVLEYATGTSYAAWPRLTVTERVPAPP